MSQPPLTQSHPSTTLWWTDYLSKVSAAFNAGIGRGPVANWPVGIAAQGNEGIGDQVRRTPNSIGYTDYAYAEANRLRVGSLQNSSRQFVSPTIQNCTAA